MRSTEHEHRLRAINKVAKQRTKDAEWEKEIFQSNPRYQVGSLRTPTEEERNRLSHCHGKVCTIVCEMCYKPRMINKQDAYHVKYCKDCVKIAKRQRAKGENVELNFVSMTLEQLYALKAELEAEHAY